MTKIKTFTIKNESGQALLFIVVVMTIALAIGINASVRTITSLSRTTRTDTASRALAAAEGGIERYLPLTTSQLEDAVSGDFCFGTRDETDPTRCLVNFGADGGIISQAQVQVTRFQPEFLEFELNPGKVKEVNFVGLEGAGSNYNADSINVCWQPGAGSTDFPDLLYVLYNDTPELVDVGGITFSAPTPPYTKSTTGWIQASNAGGEVCALITWAPADNPYGLRLHSVNGAADVRVYPTGTASLPLQGWRISSIGTLAVENEVTAAREIVVVRGLPYLPAAFDFALYTTGKLEK